MTTFKTPSSPFKSDNTASNQCGVTLMNNQVGAVVAQVMATKDNVSVRSLPSMIRVDAIGRMDFVYDEISEALGEEPGFFDAAEFEENMSTHYGRMIHEDDRTIMFANPEDAAEYIGFDLTPAVAAASSAASPDPQEEEPCTRRTARSTSSSIATCTTGTRRPDNWVPGAEQYAKGWIECFHAYQGLGPPETHWSIEHFQKYSEDDLMKDVFEDGYVDVAVFQPTYLKEWYKEGFNTTERNAEMGKRHPGKFIYNTRFDPRDGDAGPGGAQEERRDVRLEGRQAVHRRVEQRLARLQAERPGRLPVPGGRPEPRDQEHPRAQGPDDLAAGQGRVRRLRHGPLRRPTSRT